MTYVTIKVGNNYDHGSKHKEFQLDSLSTASESTIQAELSGLPECAPGSRAYTVDKGCCYCLSNSYVWVLESNRYDLGGL